jgi:glutathione S-transferase
MAAARARLRYFPQSYPGADCGRALEVLAPRILQKVSCLETQIPATSWIGGATPVVADFFVAEAFETLAYVLGAPRHAALEARFPRLAALARAVRERPQLACEFERRPSRFTARPDEDRVLERLLAADLSPVGL